MTSTSAEPISTTASPDWVTDNVILCCERGSRLVLHRVRANHKTPGAKAPVILAHGTFSNHRSCGGIARYLADQGHECWLIDFEGHGSSQTRRPSPDFETLFLCGARAAIQHINNVSGQKVHWVGHSGGGLAVLMLLARHSELSSHFRSVVLLGSQACDAGHSISRTLMLRLFVLMTRVLRDVPGRRLGLGPENEAGSVMMQWYRWNLNGSWKGSDGFDYMQALQTNNTIGSLPILSMAGSGDWFIAPPSACYKLHSVLPGEKQWQECGKQNGYVEDFTHASLVSSRAAARDIWPQIADFLYQSEHNRLQASTQ